MANSWVVAFGTLSSMLYLVVDLLVLGIGRFSNVKCILRQRGLVGQMFSIKQ